LNLYYIASYYLLLITASGTFNVSFPTIFNFLIIPESVQSYLETSQTQL